MTSVAVLGAGKLGSALAAVLSLRHHITVYDTNPAPVDAINHGDAPTDEPGLQALLDRHDAVPAAGSLWATTDITQAARAEVVFVVVPTPSEPDGRFSNAHVLDAVRSFVLATEDTWKAWQGRRIVVIVSTVMPGSCAGPIKDAANGHSVVYAPLFVALGSVIHDMTHPDVILLGADDPQAADVVEPILVGMIDAPLKAGTRVHRMSLVEAELAKLSLNVSLGVKVAFGNEVAHVAEQLGADASRVLGAVGGDSRIGPALLQVGPTSAGPCIPRDIEAFRTLGQDARVSTFVAYGASQAHRVEPQRVLDRLLWMANGEEPVVGILGIAYKAGSHVTDASIGLRVAELALHRSLLVFLHDPKARVDLAGACALDDAAELVDAADVLLLATPWPEYRTLDFRGKPVLDLWGIAPEEKGVHRFGNGTS